MTTIKMLRLLQLFLVFIESPTDIIGLINVDANTAKQMYDAIQKLLNLSFEQLAALDKA